MSETAGTEGGASTGAAPSRGLVVAGVLLGVLVGAVVLAISVMAGRALRSSIVLGVVGVLLLLVVYAFVRVQVTDQPDGARRTFAASAGGGVVLLVVPAVGWGLWSGFDPFAMTQGQINGAVAQLSPLSGEAFYLGDEAAGLHLEEITDLNPDGVVFFNYGRCLDHWVEGGCNRPMSVATQSTVSFGSRGESAHGCKSLPPVLGVPAGMLYGDVLVFTGSSIVTITYWRKIPHGLHTVPAREVAVATQLRPVGHPGAVKALPAPDAETAAFARKNCRLPAAP